MTQPFKLPLARSSGSRLPPGRRIATWGGRARDPSCRPPGHREGVPPMTSPPHASSAADVAQSLNVDLATGLTGKDALARADAQGPNTLAEAKREPVWRM